MSIALWAGCTGLPAPEDDTASVAEDTSVIIDVRKNDHDTDTIRLNTTGTEHATLLVLQGGTIQYLPEPDFEGEDSFEYFAENANGSSTARVTVKVVPDVAYARQTISVANNRLEALAAADFDGDGLMDLAGLHTDEGVSVLLQRDAGNGQRTFDTLSFPALNAKPFSGPNVRTLVVSDIDLDQKPDLVFGSYGAGGVVILLNRSGAAGPAFSSLVLTGEDYPPTDRVSVGDFDGDHVLDLALAPSFRDDISVLPNLHFEGEMLRHDPGFTIEDSFSTMIAGDLTGDGRAELLTADHYSVRMHSYDGEAGWQEIALNERRATWGLAHELDGLPGTDVLLGGGNEDGVYLLQGGETGGIVDSELNGYLLAIGDFDGNGHDEIASLDEPVLRFAELATDLPLRFVPGADVWVNETWEMTTAVLAVDMNADGLSEIVTASLHFQDDVGTIDRTAINVFERTRE